MEGIGQCFPKVQALTETRSGRNGLGKPNGECGRRGGARLALGSFWLRRGYNSDDIKHYSELGILCSAQTQKRRPVNSNHQS
jgi:hypothetical protein